MGYYKKAEKDAKCKYCGAPATETHVMDNEHGYKETNMCDLRVSYNQDPDDISFPC